MGFKMFRLFILLAFLFGLMVNKSNACTTAIVSGKFTKNGRPLIFKHRDTGELQNRLMYFDDGKYNYMGVVNSPDTLGEDVWMGTNSAGFCIMNSASYNLNEYDNAEIRDREGAVMKMALKECKTIAGFEALLDSLPKPLGVEANFGVIDAYGGAAYYETNSWEYSKIDVNDPAIAPFGYVIRTNYSFTGVRDDGYGYIRYLTQENLLFEAEATKEIDYKYFLTEISRSLKHSLLKKDWEKEISRDSKDPFYIITQDYIPRYSSASTFICEGVKEGEPAEFTTMWTILGYQFCSVAIPTWISGGSNLPQIAVSNEFGNAPICSAALELKEKVYPIKRGNGRSYLNLTALFNNKQTGIYQKIREIENNIFSSANKKLNEWRTKGIQPEEIQNYYQWLDSYLSEQYEINFGINLIK